MALPAIDQAPPRTNPYRMVARLDQRVGNTPMLDLSRVAYRRGVSPRVFLMAKAEWYNPSGSVKDRPASNIISHG